jgi:Leucine-rich repeat (LRR) protein
MKTVRPIYNGSGARALLMLTVLLYVLGLTGCGAETPSQSVDTYTAPGNGSGTPSGETPNGAGQPASPSAAPYVNAGRDQSADPNVLLMLQGETAVAQGASIRSVSWTQTEGPTVTMLQTDQLATTVLIPDLTSPAILRFMLVVIDDAGRTSLDITTLSIEPLRTFVRVAGGLANEDAGSAEFNIRLNKANTAPITVTYQTEDGTAKANEDFLPVSGTTIIPPGETSATISVTLLNDTLTESSENFSLRLTGVENGETAEAVGTTIIADDDRDFTFVIDDTTNAALASEVRSGVITLSDLKAVTTISIIDGEYAIDGGAFSNLPGTVSNGQQVQVRITTPNTVNTTRTAQLTIGTVTDNFSVTTGRPAITSITFTDVSFGNCVRSVAAQSGWQFVDEVSALNCSNLAIGAAETIWFANLRTLDLSGNQLTSIDLTTNEALINLYLYGNQLTVINLDPNTLLDIADLTTNPFSAAALSYLADLTAEARIRDLRYDLPKPFGFSFTDLFDAEPATTVQSETITLSALAGPATISISGGAYAINGGAFTSLPGTVTNGQTVQVQVNTSSTPNTTTNAALIIGTVSDTFSVTTRRPVIADIAFADAAFRTCVLEHASQLGWQFSEEVTSLPCNSRSISVAEPKWFTNLQTLELASNAITTIDLQANTALIRLDLRSNPLTAIDVGANTALTYLDLGFFDKDTNISGLPAGADLTTNSTLADLAYLNFFNQEENPDQVLTTGLLTSVDLTANTALTFLRLDNNRLASVDLSANTSLVEINLGSNRLTTIDLSANTALTSLYLYNNQLATIDLANNLALTDLHLEFNGLTAIDLANNAALTTLHLSYNELTELDLTRQTALRHLQLYNIPITFVDLSSNALLESLYFSDTQVQSIDLANNTALTTLSLSRIALTFIDLSSNPALTTLSLDGNQLSTINLDNNTVLESANLTGNRFDTATQAYLSELASRIEFLSY